TGTCACPSQLCASEFRLRGALACKAPSAPTPQRHDHLCRPSLGQCPTGPPPPGWEHIGTDLGAYSRLFRNSGVSPCNQPASRVKRSVTSSSPSRINRPP